MRNIVLSLCYDGTKYHGFQSQTNSLSIADTVKAAIKKVSGQDAVLYGCGRTDAGVHAEVYVANFLDSSAVPADRFPAALNHFLPKDIVVCDACIEDNSFNARFDCIKKEYTYRILNSATPNPFIRNYVCQYPYPLDIELMQIAAKHFEGTHDFFSVHSLGTSVKSTIRTVHYCNVIQKDNIVEISVCADGFLYNMARTIAGTLLYVSQGKIKPDDISIILEKRERKNAGPTAPASGLFLTGLWYKSFSLTRKNNKLS